MTFLSVFFRFIGGYFALGKSMKKEPLYSFFIVLPFILIKSGQTHVFNAGVQPIFNEERGIAFLGELRVKVEYDSGHFKRLKNKVL